MPATADYVARAVAGADPSGGARPYWFAVCSCGWTWGKDSLGARLRVTAQERADRHWLAEHAGIEGVCGPIR